MFLIILSILHDIVVDEMVGVAFLDYESASQSYGKIYKLKMSQFKVVLKQESGSKAYNAIIYVGDNKMIINIKFEC